jgi:hypothetical protein
MFALPMGLRRALLPLRRGERIERGHSKSDMRWDVGRTQACRKAIPLEELAAGAPLPLSPWGRRRRTEGAEGERSAA